jgi:hypothetical protein
MYKLTSWDIHIASRSKEDLCSLAERTAASRKMWETSGRNTIKRFADEYKNVGFELRVERTDSPSGGSSVQIVLPSGVVINGRHELPAQLVYSFHVDGTIAVILHPHRTSTQRARRAGGTDIPDQSSRAATREQAYAIDVFKRTEDILNARGHRRIRRHFRKLYKLSQYSCALTAPSRSGGRFLTKLERHAERFRYLYKEPAEVRHRRVEYNVNLGIAVASGLFAGTLVPTWQQIISEARARQDACEKRQSELAAPIKLGDKTASRTAQPVAVCGSSRRFDEELASPSATPTLAIVALAIVFLLIVCSMRLVSRN